MAKVSIIVPCFNTEKYLPACIDSIINQSLKDIEIILINDGSSDSSGNIIDFYAQKDNRIIAPHQNNRGISDAKNKGLEIATAPYVLFVDSDDYIDKEMVQALYQRAENSFADLVVCNIIKELEDGSIFDILDLEEKELEMKEIGLTNFYSNYATSRKLGLYNCNKLYYREIILEYNLRFSNSIYFGEDALFNLCYYLHINKIAITQKSYYHYRQRAGSIVNSIQTDKILQSANRFEIFMHYALYYQQDQLLAENFPCLFSRFLQGGIINSIDNSVPPKELYKQMEEVGDKRFFFPLMKKMVEMQLRKNNLPANQELRSIKKRFKNGLFAILSLAKMYRTLIFLSRAWRRYRQIKIFGAQKPKKLFPN